MNMQIEWASLVMRKMEVCTLGGEIKIICWIKYCYKIKDLMGEVHEFYAYGLGKVTGQFESPLSLRNLEIMFLGCAEINTLMGIEVVNYLI